MPDEFDEHTEEHPSYGLVSFHRANVGGMEGYRLFGSHLDTHQSIVTLEIRQCQYYHRHGRDKFFGRNSLIKVELSAAQFASLLTNMNAEGTPCTIKRLDNTQVAPMPFRASEQEKVRLGFRKKVQGLAVSLKEGVREVEAKLEKKSISKADMREVHKLLTKVEQEYRANMPFVLETFREAAERVVTDAKLEIDAFMTNTFAAVGLEAVKERLTGSASAKMLPFTDESTDD